MAEPPVQPELDDIPSELPALPPLPVLESRKRAVSELRSDSEGPQSGASPADHHDAEGSGRPVKKKRNRQTLSCTACKRRKIKCSRQIPCDACCKRSDPDGCHWEDPKQDVEPQPYALAAEHEQLKRRVAKLEAIIIRMQKASGQIIALGQEFDDDGEGYTSDRGRDSDTEDAALVLEELALGKKVPRIGGRQRKVALNALNAFPGTRPLAGPYDPTLTPAMKSLLVPRPEPRRKLVLDDIWKSLPQSKHLMSFLVETYFSQADWAWHLHHIPSFRAECHAYEALLAQGRRDEIDPLWIAVLSMTLCLACSSLSQPVHSPLVNISEEDLSILPQQYCEAAQAALECGDWTGLPRIRTLQAIALLSPYFLYKGSPATGLRHQTYLGAGIRMCQQLGLHQLGDDPSTMPPEDVSLPSGVNSLRREIPLRLFRNLLFSEYIQLDKIKPGLPPSQINSAMPGNYDDGDLSPTSLVAPRPADVATDTSFDLIKWKIALIQRRFNDRINSPEPIEYESTILDLDKGYREIIETLPTRFLPSYIPPLSEPLSNLWQRSMALQTINSRLLRLHRPFASRGYREAKYRTSTDSALQAARHILNCQLSLDRAPLIKQGFQLLTVQGAVVVLYMDAWNTFPRNVTESADWRLIQDVIPFFRRSLAHRTTPVRNIAQQSLNAISLLSQAIEMRRDEGLARVAAGGKWEDEGEVEPYGRLLKRTGASVSTAAAMGLDGPNAAASHIFSDRPHDFARGGPNEELTIETLSASTAPVPLDIQQPTFVSEAVLDFSNGISSDWQPSGDLIADFNLTALIQGPEFAAPGFSWDDWSTQDQFAAVLGPNL